MFNQIKVSAQISTLAIIFAFGFGYFKNPAMPQFTAAFATTFGAIFVGCLLSISAGLAKNRLSLGLGLMSSLVFASGIVAFTGFICRESKIVLNPANFSFIFILSMAAGKRILIDLQRLSAWLNKLGIHWKLWS